MQACLETSQKDEPVSHSYEDALYVSTVLACDRMPDALAAAFLCGLPGFAHPTATLLSQEVLTHPSNYYVVVAHSSCHRKVKLHLPQAMGPVLAQVVSQEGEESRHAAVKAALEQLEALAVGVAAGELTGALLPALEHTLVAVLNTPAQSATDTAEDIDGVWGCMVDLFGSADARAAQVTYHTEKASS